MKPSALTLIIAFAVVTVVAIPVLHLRAQGKSDLHGLKNIEVDCLDPTIGGPQYNCTGDMVGNGHLIDTVVFGTFLGSDASGTHCAQDSATDTIAAADGSTIILQSHGMICAEATPGFAVRHNAYLIEGGTGRFQGATGTGNIIVSSENPIGLPLVHIDGNINLP